jgi:hypothetical protein
MKNKNFKLSSILLCIIVLLNACTKEPYHLVEASNPAFFGEYIDAEVHYQADWDGAKFSVDSTVKYPGSKLIFSDVNSKGTTSLNDWYILGGLNQLGLNFTGSAATNNSGLFKSMGKSRLSFANFSSNTEHNSIVDVTSLTSSALSWEKYIGDPISGDFQKYTVVWKRIK